MLLILLSSINWLAGDKGTRSGFHHHVLLERSSFRDLLSAFPLAVEIPIIGAPISDLL